MIDLISRQKAIDAIRSYQTSNDLYYRESHELMTVGYVEEKLLALPSAQPEVLACGEGELIAQAECKRGEWIIRTRHEHFPSGKEYTELVCPFCGRTDHNGDGCYCGYCGARMEE